MQIREVLTVLFLAFAGWKDWKKKEISLFLTGCFGILGIGFSIYAADVQDVNTEYDFDSELTQLPDLQEGFKVFYMRPIKAMKLPYTAGIHMNLGTEYVGKTAYLYSKSLLTGNYALVSVTTVNEIGNVAIQTNELTDIIVLIAQ